MRIGLVQKASAQFEILNGSQVVFFAGPPYSHSAKRGMGGGWGISFVPLVSVPQTRSSQTVGFNILCISKYQKLKTICWTPMWRNEDRVIESFVCIHVCLWGGRWTVATNLYWNWSNKTFTSVTNLNAFLEIQDCLVCMFGCLCYLNLWTQGWKDHYFEINLSKI